MYDVLVIGGGMAGSIAALEANRLGARVAVASRSFGATALSTGAIDIAYTPALSPAYQSPRTLAEHVMDIVAHRSAHPYAVLGVERTFSGLRGGYERLQEACTSYGSAGAVTTIPELDMEDENQWLPSALGTLMPVARAYGAHIGLNLWEGGDVGILQFRGDAHFDAQAVQRGITFDATSLGLSSPDFHRIEVTGAAHSPMAMARVFDDFATVDRLIESLTPQCSGLRGLVVPPVFGLSRAETVLRRLGDALGMPVVEALSCIPSVPGVRLQRTLQTCLHAKAIDHLDEVIEPIIEGSTVKRVRTKKHGEVGAGAVILATGRFISGGIAWHQQCREALFDFPVSTEVGVLEDDSPHATLRETPQESHPLMTAGLFVNKELQPVYEGKLAYDNLYAAGMVIGGFASRYALCADGVAVSTGCLAARAAVANVGRV
ncbi:MAG: FAD-binding protein [Myxococcota bacterium]